MTPTPEQLLRDPSTPFWAADVIRVALSKDPVDATGVFEVLARSFSARADQILKQGIPLAVCAKHSRRDRCGRGYLELNSPSQKEGTDDDEG